jgi:clan AA aspartic protease (TIGR02281 family)
MTEFFFDSSKPMIPILVTLNGRKGIVRVQGILSTGSTFVSIPEEVAETLGYDTSKAKEKMKVSTPNGIIDVPVITLDEVSVLGLSAPRVKAIVVPFPEESRVNCILGLTYLRHFSFAVDYATGAMTIE